MCGIVGATAVHSIEKTLIDGLKRLEYRGYDSAGLAVLNGDHSLECLRALGKVRELEQLLNRSNTRGNSGIAHTRWATHGIPSEKNAHPLMSNNEIVLVHNGIIENHETLKLFLIEKGYTFESETDTETIVHLLHYHFQSNHDLLLATQITVDSLKGSYALGILSIHDPNRLIAVHQGCPIVIGKGEIEGENYFASDSLALIPLTKNMIYLEGGDIACITPYSIDIYDANRQPIQRKLNRLDLHLDLIDRGKHRHFMIKEIFEQPQAILNNFEGRIGNQCILESAFSLNAKDIFKRTQHIQIIACGTSYHAAMVARYWIESLVGISCSVEVASEFRYRKTVVQPNSLFVTISQSGETADTLAALRLAKNSGFLGSLTICNVPESALVRESDFHFMTRAGVEIGVASTKAFTTQLTALALFTLALGNQRNLSSDIIAHLINELKKLPDAIDAVLKLNPIIIELAKSFIDKEHALFLGRGAMYPIALEGALKLKEISYIHAEGYPAGELKHGPLALVDKLMPVVVVAPNDDLLDKLKSNLQVVRARGGKLYVFTDSVTTSDPDIHIIEMPSIDPFFAPILYTVPLQLVAYHVAVLKGTDVDQPRNLAKSVTVE
jgi:glucosamine--fructose-6-phosphate aminotransferase (isomerizing)